MIAGGKRGHGTVQLPYQAATAELKAALDTAPASEPNRTGNGYGVFFTSDPKALLFGREQLWHGSTQVIMEIGSGETDRALVTTPWFHMVTTDA